MIGQPVGKHGTEKTSGLYVCAVSVRWLLIPKRLHSKEREPAQSDCDLLFHEGHTSQWAGTSEPNLVIHALVLSGRGGMSDSIGQSAYRVALITTRYLRMLQSIAGYLKHLVHFGDDANKFELLGRCEALGLFHPCCTSSLEPVQNGRVSWWGVNARTTKHPSRMIHIR